MVLTAVALASVLIGNQGIGLRAALDAYVHPDGSDVQRIVQYLRVPRTLVGLLGGAALGVAGALLQGLTRNALAGPEVLGVNAGAALAVVLGIAVAGAHTFAGWVWFSFGGAALAGTAVYALGSLGRGGATPVKLALAGAAATALLGGLTTAVTLLDITTFTAYRYWSVGALTSADATVLRASVPFLAVGAVLAVASVRALDALALGDDLARSLGQSLTVGRATAALGVVVLAGTAVALAGPIAFVGLTVPHMARALTGPSYRWVLPYSAVLAPAVLLAADILGRVVARPQELQAGIVTAIAGAPFFIALVRRRGPAAL
ncbi:FecCD family ABC transporter permease [Actinoplanes sp. RD1]|uniref:FecCD family ABC transporter permease n=1 Tax=Actinoplanes sp. RD1 TaxID=3064538 RepID=UPI0027413943|nr:iron ABC transporter permease [Actinoplanes sp. RD1]